MISRTKYKIDNAAIEKLFRSAGIDGALEIAPLGDGEYNAVFAVKTNGSEYAVKIAPADDIPVLTYEKNIITSEVFWYKQIKEHSSIIIPEIYYSDFEKKIIPANYFIMEKLSGNQLNKMNFSQNEKVDSISEMAKMAAQIHKIRNDKFGYIQNNLYDNWYQAIREMVKSLINDCKRKGRSSKRGEKLLTCIDRYKTVLERAECSMVNFDIWPPNIICKRENGEIKFAWIDPERSFWGDRIADFVCLEMMTPLAEKKTSLSAYNSAADKKVLVTEEEKIRYAVAQGYLGLIMETEKYFRYTPFDLGWWRNIFVSALLFKAAFGALL
jgi:aminoglycoside phosphotransferase (APT) family kinase protein